MGFLAVISLLVCVAGVAWLVNYYTQPQRKPAAPHIPSVAPEYAPDWLEQDRLAWCNFLQSDHGKTMIARARAVEWSLLRKASEDVFHTSHTAGVAKGYGDCLNWLESLSRSSRAQDDSGSETEQTDTTPTGELETVN